MTVQSPNQTPRSAKLTCRILILKCDQLDEQFDFLDGAVFRGGCRENQVFVRLEGYAVQQNRMSSKVSKADLSERNSSIAEKDGIVLPDIYDRLRTKRVPTSFGDRMAKERVRSKRLYQWLNTFQGN